MRAKQPKRVHLVADAAKTKGLSYAQISRRAEAMLDALQLKNEELSLVLTNDDQIHELNKLYRGKDRPTDVLAFAQREGEFASMAGALLGDVVISIPTASRQARAAKRDLLGEVTMLLAHGLLHLLGWDHETAAKDKKMRAETDRLIAAAVTTEREIRPSRALKGKTGARASALSKGVHSRRPSPGKR